MLIAQITDVHIAAGRRLVCGRVDTASRLEQVVRAINALEPQPAVVLATGDLGDLGTVDEYGLLLDLLGPLKAPLRVVPGNHDGRGPLAAAFAGQPGMPGDGSFLHYTLEDWPVRLIALDTVVPGQPDGLLCRERLTWLEARLAEQPERPTVIFQHHPPFPTGIIHMDAIGLSGADDQAAVVRRHPQVERVLCGHLHRPIQARWAGTLASTAPSTAHQLALDLRPDGPPALILEPPGYQLHQWIPGFGFASHTAQVGPFAGPYPFFDPTTGGMIG
jgi:3',5'-cyclic AMP phosphodiesterase CpdA